MLNLKLKYVITDKKHERFDSAFRIRALVDIPLHGVTAGDLGGFIETTNNLSHTGNAWVGDDAVVRGDSQVTDDAYVGKRAIVSGESVVSENAYVSDDAFIGNSCARGFAMIAGDANVTAYANVTGYARVTGNTFVRGALLTDSAYVSGRAWVDSHAHLRAEGDCVVLEGLPSGDVTITRRTSPGAWIRVGCWSGTSTNLRELIAGTDWPSADLDQQKSRRPGLECVASLADALTITWNRVDR